MDVLEVTQVCSQCGENMIIDEDGVIMCPRLIQNHDIVYPIEEKGININMNIR